MSFARRFALRASAATLAPLAWLCAPAAGEAQELNVVARAAGGYDGNPSLAAPENRRGPLDASATPDGFARAELALRGALGAAPSVGAALDADARLYGSGHARAWERLRLSAGTRAGRARPSARLEASRYDASGTEDAAWTGRARLALDLELLDELTLGADAFGGVRAYDRGGQVDTLAGAGVTLGGTSGALDLGAGVALDRRFSTDAVAERTEVAPWALVRLTAGAFQAELQYIVFVRFFDEMYRDDVEHVGRLGVSVRMAPWLRAFAATEVGFARGGVDALVYDRVEASGGLEIAFHVAGPPPVAPAATGPASPAPPGGTRFRFEIPGARDVRVVGTFNDWDPERGRLRPTGQGQFVGVVPVAPGHHRYHLLVDGEPRRPEGAERYVRDDLGGEDAVLVVVGPQDSDGAEVVQQPR